MASKPRTKRTRKAKSQKRREGPQPKRTHKFKEPKNEIIPPMSGDDDLLARLPLPWRINVVELRALTKPTERHAYLMRLPTAFWLSLVATFPSLKEVWRITGIGDCCVRRHMMRLRLPYDHRPFSPQIRQAYDRRAKLATLIETFAPKCRTPLKLHGPAIITACGHAPAVAESLLAKALEIAEALQIRVLIHVGDLANYDYFRRNATDEAGTATRPENEYNVVDGIMDFCKPQIKTFYWIRGNHEDMFLRAIKAGFDPERLRGFVKATGIRLVLTWHSYIYLDGWTLTHCRNYSKARMTVARQLQAKYPKQSIAHAHTHRLSLGYSDSGAPIVELPGIHDPGRINYLCRDQTTHPEQNVGFFVWWRNNMIPYAEGFTDKFWDAFLEQRRVV